MIFGNSGNSRQIEHLVLVTSIFISSKALKSFSSASPNTASLNYVFSIIKVGDFSLLKISNLVK
jgi:hypothetical protein